MRSLFVCLYILFVVAGCGYNRFDSLPETTPSTLIANKTLANVAQFYSDGEVDMPENTIVTGTVTTSDSTENFYKVILIQQGDTPLAILTGTYDIYTNYRQGEQVTVRLDGLRLGLHEGMLAAGAAGVEYDTQIEYISSEAVVQRIMVRANDVRPEPVVPLLLTLADVTTDMTGRLVRITGGAFTQGGKQSWSNESSGERTFAALEGGSSIKVYTNPSATFAEELLPEGTVDLVGIVTSYKDAVQIKISSTEDVYY